MFIILIIFNFLLIIIFTKYIFLTLHVHPVARAAASKIFFTLVANSLSSILFIALTSNDIK